MFFSSRLLSLSGWPNGLGKVLNLSGQKTYYVSLDSTPDTDRVNAIDVLLREAKEQKRKSALKLLVRVALFHRAVLIRVIIQLQLRNIPTCPIAGLKLRQSENEKLGIVSQTDVGPKLAHIVPFSLRYNVRRAYSLFF